MTRFACWFDAGRPADAIAAAATLAEDLRFDTAVVAGRGPAGELWPALGAAAATTRTIRLLAVMTVPVAGSHPLGLAQASAALAWISGGRFAIAIAAGEPDDDAAVGRPAVPNYQRMGRLKAAIPLTRALLAGELVSEAGPFYTVTGARLPAIPERPVPIWMVADGPSSGGMAGRLADGAIVEAGDPEETLREVVEPYRAAASEARRDPQLMVVVSLAADAHDATALAVLSPHVVAIRATGADEAAVRTAATLRDAIGRE